MKRLDLLILGGAIVGGIFAHWVWYFAGLMGIVVVAARLSAGGRR